MQCFHGDRQKRKWNSIFGEPRPCHPMKRDPCQTEFEHPRYRPCTRPTFQSWLLAVITVQSIKGRAINTRSPGANVPVVCRPADWGKYTKDQLQAKMVINADTNKVILAELVDVKVANKDSRHRCKELKILRPDCSADEPNGVWEWTVTSGQARADNMIKPSCICDWAWVDIRTDDVYIEKEIKSTALLEQTKIFEKWFSKPIVTMIPWLDLQAKQQMHVTINIRNTQNRRVYSLWYQALTWCQANWCTAIPEAEQWSRLSSC